MIVKVKAAKSFQRSARRLIRKYNSLKEELHQLENELLINPELGTPLGLSAYKIRLKIKSKGKGKSGGGRVITYVETIALIEDIEKTVNLLAIYDKSEVETIGLNELKKLIEQI